ncbi:leucine-rich repeat domain-containing protein [Chitinophaga varians]|uniref:leucine-rich repeat domain-containing protein n=1 Tax=Chitinophaga varians TaxID=2202339 RepID=UPI00165ECDA6|nr:leucine-rich repeat domain-containing protein [Chitinophaga varians]MBC9912732.1 leucine-rich repeat domain-containing protein [Chitinophaga varians]
MDYFETHIMKAAQETGYVDLQQKRLTTLPPGYEAAARLSYVHIDVSSNQRLQHEKVIGQLASIPHIQALSMVATNMEEIPADITRLSGLEYLDLSDNKLIELPASIGHLRQLKVLKLNDNKLDELPVLKHPMPFLEELHLSGNPLEAIDLTPFPALKKLYLCKTALSNLPVSITRLAQLEILVLDNNEQLNIEDTCWLLAGCRSLRRLSMRKCAINKAPESIRLLRQLIAIDLRKSRYEPIPDILKMTEMTEIDCDWPLPAPFYFNMIKDRADTRSFSLTKILPYQEDGVRTLPANVGALQHLDALTCADLQRLPAAINHLKRLKSLAFINGKYDSLPDLSSLQGLEEVTISGTGFTAFPEFIYQLPALKTLTIERCMARPDYRRIARIPTLEKLTADDMTAADLQNFMQPVEGRYIEVVLTTTPLPDAFYDLPCITMFDLNEHEDTEVEPLLAKLCRLPNLHTLIFNKVRPLPVGDCIRWLRQFPRLKAVTLYLEEQQVPASLADLSHLEHIYLHWNESCQAIPDLPPLLANTRPGQLVLEKTPFTAAYLHAFEVLNTRGITGTGTRELAFCLLARRYDTLRKMLPWPFTPDGQLPGAQVYIAGEPTMCTRKELKEILLQRGATVTRAVAEATHIFVGRNISATVIAQLSGRLLHLVLEDHLKEQLQKEDTPFLLGTEGEALISQVTRLLKTDNSLMLALQIIRGGGANPIVLGYLAAIYLFYYEEDMVAEAKGLFRKFASADLQYHIEVHWKEAYRYKREDAFTSLYLHPEMDMFAFLLAFMKIRGAHTLGNLWLKDIPDTAVTDSIRDLYPMNMVCIESRGSITQLLARLPLLHVERLVIEAPLDTLPPDVWHIPTLRGIKLVLKGSSGFTIPPLESAHMAFSRLQVENGHIINPEGLAACTQLKECLIIDGNLSTADFATGMPLLETLDLSNNHIAALPAGLTQCTQLSSLNIAGNSVTEEAVDALKLPKLHTLNYSPYKQKY